MGLKVLRRCYLPANGLRKKSDQGGIERKFIDARIFDVHSFRRNQTKVGLKVISPASYLRPLMEEEIRPRWDWKLAPARTHQLPILPRRNQTKVGLKVRDVKIKLGISDTRRNQTKVGLKVRSPSPQVRQHSWRNQTKVGLKVYIPEIAAHAIVAEEIRPRWDWKLLPWTSPHPHQWQKKSDQGGIERRMSAFYHLSISRRNQTKVGLKAHSIISLILSKKLLVRGRNQTKVGLKAMYDGASSATFFEEIRPRWDWKDPDMPLEAWGQPREEIRPRWDWKGLYDISYTCAALTRRNQTKVGLKESWSRKMFGREITEEIRPRWDWKKLRVA